MKHKGNPNKRQGSKNPTTKPYQNSKHANLRDSAKREQERLTRQELIRGNN